jgi:hypothetical protein
LRQLRNIGEVPDVVKVVLPYVLGMSTFLDVVELLLTSSEAKTSYTDNPAAFLEEHGLESFDSVDVSDAMHHAADALPLPVAMLVDPSAGLGSAASVDLEAAGLSLDREPVLTEDPPDLDSEPGDLDPNDLDPNDLDSLDSYGDDVPFDISAEADKAESVETTQAESSLDESYEPLNARPVQEQPIDALDDLVANDEDSLTTTDNYDNSLYPAEDQALDTLGALDGEDLESDTQEDVPDDFDLLD